jgi:murein DD-endopeptidase MepM/ murein hydrolase activator NlpD
MLAANVLAAMPAIAQTVTVYHQPTPTPKYRWNGSTVDDNGVSLEPSLARAHVFDGWMNNTFSSIETFQRDAQWKIGGWGDWYRTYMNFDLTGLPANPTNVALWMRFYPPGTALTQFMFCIPSSPWNTTVTWNTQPTIFGCTNAITPPSGDTWGGWYITSWYQNWKNGVWGPNGIELWAITNTNTFDFMRSSRYPYAGWPDFALRPTLQFDFTPPTGATVFKLPLPGNTKWILNGEAGGYECKGESPLPDTTHQGNNYFALDFGPDGILDSGGAYSNLAGIPILAAASGTVSDVAVTNVSGNGGRGWYITLDHGNGYRTRYLHFANRAARKNGAFLHLGDWVFQGDQLGYMGGSGGFPVHLHINFWYAEDQNGASTIPQLTYVTMERLLIKSYQTECSVNPSNGWPTGRTLRYHSTNTPTGN